MESAFSKRCGSGMTEDHANADATMMSDEATEPAGANRNQIPHQEEEILVKWQMAGNLDIASAKRQLTQVMATLLMAFPEQITLIDRKHREWTTRKPLLRISSLRRWKQLRFNSTLSKTRASKSSAGSVSYHFSTYSPTYHHLRQQSDNQSLYHPMPKSPRRKNDPSYDSWSISPGPKSNACPIQIQNI